MALRRPRIGLVADQRYVTVGPWTHQAAVTLPIAYVRSVAAAGGIPFVIPVDESYLVDPRSVLVSLDGLVLIGGRDFAASQFDQAEHTANDTRDDLSDLRDQVEFAVARAAWAADLPILGICRGMQMINVLAGGDLEQHLGDRLDLTPHRDQLGEFTRHTVTATSRSRLASIIGESPVDVASHHHQGVGHLAGPLDVAARAVDGVIEAIETQGSPLRLGVLWHPEQDQGHPAADALFAAFIDAARASGGALPASSAYVE